MALSGNDWVRLNTLLDQALDLEPSQRADWVESLPQEFDALRATLRDLLLRPAGVETRDIMERAPSFATVQIAEPSPGELIGPYRLVRKVGAGGMATVWLANRIDGVLQRQVAVKLPRISPSDRELGQRLNRERDILASLEHPGIARLYDAGTDSTGRPFFVMEYVDAMPLDRYIETNSPSTPQRLELFL
jgi:eukaryotic-like serine/threonine-protein kinase